MTTLGSIANIVTKSNLSLAEQLELMTIFSQADNDQQKEIFEYIKSDGSWVERIYENYQAKKSALSVHDKTAWQMILKGEEQQLNSITGKLIYTIIISPRTLTISSFSLAE